MLAVKHFRDVMPGAPVLSGTPGALIALLDACLIDGFNAYSVDSLTQADGIATATVAAGHSYADGDTLLITGADQAAYNGEFSITNSTGTSFDFAVDPATPSPATGAVSSKIAPVGGWSKVFVGSNTAVYRSGAADGLVPHYYRVDHSNGTDARVRGYESMTDVDTGIGPMPTDAQVSGGAYWRCSDLADGTARAWTLMADPGLLYWMPDRSSNGAAPLYVIGQQDSWQLGDQYAGVVVGHDQANGTDPTAMMMTDGTQGNGWVARDHSQIGAPAEVSAYGHRAAFGSVLGYDSRIAYPGLTDGGLYHAPLLWGEFQDRVPRGRCLGLHQPLQTTPLVHGDIAAAALDGYRDLLAVELGFYSSGWRYGQALFDITGPWR